MVLHHLGGIGPSHHAPRGFAARQLRFVAGILIGGIEPERPLVIEIAVPSLQSLKVGVGEIVQARGSAKP